MEDLTIVLPVLYFPGGSTQLLRKCQVLFLSPHGLALTALSLYFALMNMPFCSSPLLQPFNSSVCHMLVASGGLFPGTFHVYSSVGVL